MTSGTVLERTNSGPLNTREQRVFSFEFYPPKTAEGAQRLRTTWKQLGQLDPQFFSVTYGAGGSTREGTLRTVLEIRKDGHAAAPHISCIASSRESGIGVPIVPGIMPINNFSQLARFSDACGAEIPRWMRMKLESYGDDTASIKAFGLDVVTDLCDRLLQGGAPGLHFYTMNMAGPASTIWQRLGL